MQSVWGREVCKQFTLRVQSHGVGWSRLKNLPVLSVSKEYLAGS